MWNRHLFRRHKRARRLAPMPFPPLFSCRRRDGLAAVRRNTRALQYRARLLGRGRLQQHLPQLPQARVFIGQHPRHLSQRFHGCPQLTVIVVAECLMAGSVHHSL